MIKVPAQIEEDILALRDSGMVNMLSIGEVLSIMDNWEMEDTAEWIRENRREYFRGILEGFEVEE